MWGKKNNNGALPGSNRGISTQNDVIEKLAIDYMKDRKWKRIFRFSLLAVVFIYLFSLLGAASQQAGLAGATKSHTALVDLVGIIGIEGGITSDSANRSIGQAFKARQSKGVVIRINSPGGSPVQSDEINSEITRLKAIYPNKPVYVVVSDICASGGYYIAAAADSIYANPSSIVGSIGVRMDSFGFVEALNKLGVERRSLTAGENKAILDPFLPVEEGQQVHAQEMLEVVHQEFINVVKAGRGDRIGDDPDLFSGLFWSGRQAKELGLIDDFGGLDYVARDLIGAENVVDYTHRPDLLTQLSRDFGVAVGGAISAALGGQLQIK